jgi:TonB family protein
LLNVVLDLNPDPLTTNQIYQRLGREVAEIVEDPLIVLVNQAEDIWLKEKQPRLARDHYLQIAEKADTTSDLRARVLLASAHSSLIELGEDSTAREYYELIKKDFSGSEYSQVARDKLTMIDKHKPLPEPEEEPELEEPAAEEAPADSLTIGMPFDDFGILEPEEIVERIVYDPEDADVLPELAIPLKIFQNLVKNAFPSEFFGEDIEVEVWVEFVVEPSGNVTDLEVLSIDPDEPEFDFAARKVMETVRYKPGRVKGKFSSIRMKQKLLFKEF